MAGAVRGQGVCTNESQRSPHENLVAKPGLVGLSLVSSFLRAAPAFSAEPKAQPAASRAAVPSVTFHDGLLSVEASGQLLLKEAVVEALGAIGSPEAEQVLRQAVGDEDEGVRDAAATELARLGTIE